MKKLLGIVVLGLMWCNVGFAESDYEKAKAEAEEALKEQPNYSAGSLNWSIKKYKWKKTGSFKAEGGVRVITLKKGQWILYCAMYVRETKCWLP